MLLACVRQRDLGFIAQRTAAELVVLDFVRHQIAFHVHCLRSVARCPAIRLRPFCIHLSGPPARSTQGLLELEDSPNYSRLRLAKAHLKKDSSNFE